MRENRERFLYNKGFQSITYEEVKSTATFTNVDELRFRTSEKTQSTTDKKDAKSTHSSIGEFLNPLVPKKRRGKARWKFFKKSHEGLKLKNEGQEEKRAERVPGIRESTLKEKKKYGKGRFRKLGLDPALNFSSQIKAGIDHQEGQDTEIKSRIMKQIFITDMDRHQECFLMPLIQVKDCEEFLNEEEMKDLCQTKSNGT
uniref:Uncharacterized protein n=1 Tax=Populus trichocarpa TaxID=3694 RepID=B9MZH8_POPTR